MKKTIAFLGVTLILFFIFACTMPSELNIKGSPSLKFAANMDLNDYFSEMIDNAIGAEGETKTIPCTNPSLEYKVFLFRTEIYKNDNYKCEVGDTFNNDNEGYITINDVDIPVKIEDDDSEKFVVLENEEDIADSEPYQLTFKGLEEYIEGFEFTDIQSKIYIYGTELAELVSIDLYRVKDGVDTIFVPDEEIKKGPSSGTEFLEEYTGLALPPGGGDIHVADTINKGETLSIKTKIYLPKDKHIDYKLLQETHTITAEIVIWLTLTLESIEENAVFKFPGFFDGISNVINSLAETGYIEDMNIKMSIDPINPFGKGIFTISDDGYGYIKNPLDDHSFFIDLNEEEVDYINEHPFDPRFFILYPNKGSILEIPNKDIIVTTVLLNAGLNYIQEF